MWSTICERKSRSDQPVTSTGCEGSGRGTVQSLSQVLSCVRLMGLCVFAHRRFDRGSMLFIISGQIRQQHKDQEDTEEQWRQGNDTECRALELQMHEVHSDQR